VTERDLSKLPKWAQMRIEKLEHDVAYLRAKLSAGDEDSVVFADPHSSARRPLGDSDVEFRLGAEKILVRVESGGLYVNGSRGIAIEPQAGNAVHIRTGTW
jgi:hypothetical protein